MTDKTIPNKEIIKKYIEEIVNTGNVENISDFVADDYEEIHNGKRIKMGIQGAIDHILGVHKTYPDIKLTIDQQFSEDDYVITCFTMQGTHSGEWMGIKPTNKRINVTGVNVDRLKEDKIIEHGGAANMLESLLEIQAIRIVSSD